MRRRESSHERGTLEHDMNMICEGLSCVLSPRTRTRTSGGERIPVAGDYYVREYLENCIPCNGFGFVA